MTIDSVANQKTGPLQIQPLTGTPSMQNSIQKPKLNVRLPWVTFGLSNGVNPINPAPTGSFAQVHGGAASMHEGGAQFGFADGSVRFISENIHHTSRSNDAFGGFDPIRNDPYDRANNGADYGTYQRLWSRADGYVIGEF
jgi:prepilin-type processing-associated H-X9-DG protein